MRQTSALQSANQLPDHGYGPLGQVTHGALAQSRDGGRLDHPHLCVGYNTLPEAPFPMVGFLAQGAEPDAWERCGGDLLTFLSAGAESLRRAPVPPPGAFGEDHHRLQRMMRIDAQVVVWRAHMIRPGESAAGRALTDNLVEGYLRPGDLEASPAATPTLTAWSVDREGASLTMWVDPADSSEEAEFNVVGPGVHDPVSTALTELLAAQYEWTRQAFGL